MLTDQKQLNQNSFPEIWGGIECTINRVNDVYYDQLEYAQHYYRDNDIELIAGLGIKTLRYPILWEKHEPVAGQTIDWSWTEKQLNTLQANHIVPIAGLIHHGSGPIYTDLLSDNFATGLSSYAKKVAEKFPWIQYYTPVNEPLTTARFSGLYGFWYPHVKNDISFAKMLLNQVKAIVLSMAEIRKINPEAKLVQTEDLSKTYSTPSLQFQANFENIRRWLTFDLLCGKVDETHSMWKYFSRLGIKEDVLNFFLENPCPPDILGLNYYVTSERFLDENVKKYPAYVQGGNELQQYADVEAVRVKHNHPSGLNVLLKEAWERFGLPMAITEAQLNCSRDDQLRWFKEIWESCILLKKEGVDIRAVTAWSLLGAFGWNRLLTSKKMEYEVGAFDLRSGTPRPTAITSLIKQLVCENNFDHPVLGEKGWWHRVKKRNVLLDKAHLPYSNIQPLLIIGKRGTLGNAFSKICNSRGIHHYLLGREDVDITDACMVEEIIKTLKPWALINCAGFVKVDEAETQAEQCFRENTIGPEIIGAHCKNNGVQFVTFSSDLVFDGKKGKAYRETDLVSPINIYGKSKANSEEKVLLINPDAMIIRTSTFFGPWDEYNFAHNMLQTLRDNKIFNAASDVIISPTYVPDLVNATLDLLIDKEKGIWHITNRTEISWADLALTVAVKAGLNEQLIIPLPMSDLNRRAAIPRYSALKSEKGIQLPSLENALSRYFEEKIFFPREPVH
ncbi:MAG: sugar nucleotide-binding protein [Chitinophagaceae bacterium]|nr:sugar nucleotide-binding protein [Chitinophagaceae bacterium]